MSTSITRRVTAAIGALVLGAATAMVAIAPAQAATTPGNIDPAQPRSLTVHKYELGPTSPQSIGTGQELPPGTDLGRPLSGAVFTATLVEGVDLTTPEGWTQVSNLTPQTAAGRLGTTSFQSAASDAGGTAAFPGDMPLGLFLVRETTLPAGVTNPVAPFLVALPTPTGSQGAPANQWIYDVHVYPKNAVTELTKTRVPAPANSDEARNPDLIRWAIASTVPTLAAGDAMSTFRLTDTIPSQLEFVPTPPPGVEPTRVRVRNAAGLGQSFTEGTDYSVTTDAAAGTQTLEFTAAGLSRLTGLQGGVVSFEVLTRATAIPEGGRIQNTATGVINGSTETVVGTTPIGQLTVFAYESTNGSQRVPLAGAGYRVYLTQQDADRNENPIFIDGVSEWRTGANGYVEIPIITPGSYWVREITPPSGFQLPAPDRLSTLVVAGPTSTVTPVQNYLEFNHNQVVPGFLLPLTGGDGGLWFGVGGGALVLMAIGAAVLVARRRRTVAPAGV